jgi:hypothetical protein
VGPAECVRTSLLPLAVAFLSPQFVDTLAFYQGIYLTAVVLVVSQRKMLSPEVLAYTSQSVRLESLTGSGTVPAAWSAPTPPRRKEGKSFNYPDRVHVVQTREYYSSSPRDSYL